MQPASDENVIWEHYPWEATADRPLGVRLYRADPGREAVELDPQRYVGRTRFFLPPELTVQEDDDDAS